MKIWIDFINSPQVSFFEPLIEDLSNNGHEFILTCRDSANTVQLIKKRNWQFTIIGNKAEKSFIKKIFSFPIRIFSLYRHLRNKNIEIAIGQSSFYLPMTANFSAFLLYILTITNTLWEIFPVLFLQQKFLYPKI